MKEYVEREEAMALAKDIVVPTIFGNTYRHRCIDPQEIAEIPAADVVEVVRCWECEHWDRDWKSYISGENKHFCPMINLITDADFFCKDGKCKGKGGDE